MCSLRRATEFTTRKTTPERLDSEGNLIKIYPMFRYYSPGVTIFSLVAAGVLSLFKRSPKRTYKSQPTHQPYIPKIRRVVDAHKDYTAEVFNVFVHGQKKVAVSSVLVPGDSLDVKINGEFLDVYKSNIWITSTALPESSLLQRVFSERQCPEAYLGGRDVSNSSEVADFATIIVFYKLEGVLPTVVDLE